MIEQDNHLEDRPVQLGHALEAIAIASDIFVDKTVKSFQLTENGVERFIDRDIMKMVAGGVRGITSEMISEGQGEVAHEIFHKGEVTY